MAEAQIIGFVVIGIAALVSLFSAIYKPLNENTKAVTELTVKMEQLITQMQEHDEDLKEYKEHVSDGQRRQWDAINENTRIIHDVKNKIKEE